MTLTPDSPAVRLYAAWGRYKELKGIAAWLNGDGRNARVDRATWDDVAAEHERIVQERIAGAVKEARVQALKEALDAVEAETKHTIENKCSPQILLGMSWARQAVQHIYSATESETKPQEGG